MERDLEKRNSCNDNFRGAQESTVNFDMNTRGCGYPMDRINTLIDVGRLGVAWCISIQITH